MIRTLIPAALVLFAALVGVSVPIRAQQGDPTTRGPCLQARSWIEVNQCLQFLPSILSRLEEAERSLANVVVTRSVALSELAGGGQIGFNVQCPVGMWAISGAFDFNGNNTLVLSRSTPLTIADPNVWRFIVTNHRPTTSANGIDFQVLCSWRKPTYERV